MLVLPSSATEVFSDAREVKLAPIIHFAALHGYLTPEASGFPLPTEDCSNP